MNNVVQLTKKDTDELYELLRVFSDAFEDPDHYLASPPSETYLKKLLSSETFIALTCRRDDQIVGGLIAYELIKFEREQSEIYLYDIGVSARYRRQGIASALLDNLQQIAEQRGASVVYVQADGDDDAAIALYSGRGSKAAVFHFEFPTAVDL